MLSSIENLKEIIKVPDSLSSENAFYFLLKDTNIQKLKVNLKDILSNLNSDQLIVLGLEKENQEKRSVVLLISRPCEFTQAFEESLFTHLDSGSTNGILEHFSQTWKKNTSRYPLTILLSTNMKTNSTLLADCAVAPDFRNKGLMKETNIAVVKHLCQVYGENHKLVAFTIHPATYLFFHPEDKLLKNFDSCDGQEKTCLSILEAHSAENKQPLKDFSLFQPSSSEKPQQPQSVQAPLQQFMSPP